MAWVMALSIGFFGVKGGIFTVVGGGENMVWGPPGSFIEGNNELALALIMVLLISVTAFAYKSVGADGSVREPGNQLIKIGDVIWEKAELER